MSNTSLIPVYFKKERHRTSLSTKFRQLKYYFAKKVRVSVKPVTTYIVPPTAKELQKNPNLTVSNDQRDWLKVYGTSNNFFPRIVKVLGSDKVINYTYRYYFPFTKIPATVFGYGIIKPQHINSQRLVIRYNSALQTYEVSTHYIYKNFHLHLPKPHQVVPVPLNTWYSVTLQRKKYFNLTSYFGGTSKCPISATLFNVCLQKVN